MDFITPAIYTWLKELPAWILIALGFHLAFRVIQFPDLTVEGSYVAGAVGACVMAVHYPHSSGLGLVVGTAIGALAGAVTGLIFVMNPQKPFKLLAGLLVYLSMYSLHYRLLGGTTLGSYVGKNTLFTWIKNIDTKLYIGGHSLLVWRPLTTAFGFALCAIIYFSVRWYLQTESGLRLRAVGTRPYMLGAKRGGFGKYIVAGLILSNATVAVGAWYISSMREVVDITIYGTVLHALAASVVGETLLGLSSKVKHKYTSLNVLLLAPVIGCIIYQFFRNVILAGLSSDASPNQMSFGSRDSNAVTALLILCLIFVIRYIHDRWHADEPAGWQDRSDE